MDYLLELYAFLEKTNLFPIVRAILFLTVGYVVARSVSKLITSIAKEHFSKHGLIVLQRVSFYFIFLLFLASALRHLGLDLSVLLGAAGILTVAIGFASQTSASNLISGIFLMLERPFSIADVIRVGAFTGEVISIDLLSIKLRTFDNLFVRIPNETMIKTEVVTMTKFPIRRADIVVGIAYKENIARVKKLLDEIAAKNPLCLDNPEPLFIVTGFGSSSIDIQFSVWAKRENFLALKNKIYEEIKMTFDENGVEIPFPHLSLYAGSQTQPFPVTQKASNTEVDATESPSNAAPPS